ncbi:TetR/AcrR family transcriptional regulator [Streptacidiphilus sp. PAMC 29251]
MDAPTPTAPAHASQATSTHGTYLGRTRDERVADRRGRLMQAAFELFATHSYEDVTVADVCAHAKVAKRYFYEHFTDRSTLLLSVQKERNDWLLAGLEAAAPRQPTTLQALLSPMMAALTTMLAADPRSARIIYLSAPQMELHRRNVIRQDAKRFSTFITTALQQHPHDLLQYHRAVLALTAGLSEVIIEWLDEDMPDDAPTLAGHLTGTATALLAPCF